MLVEKCPQNPFASYAPTLKHFALEVAGKVPNICSCTLYRIFLVNKGGNPFKYRGHRFPGGEGGVDGKQATKPIRLSGYMRNFKV